MYSILLIEEGKRSEKAYGRAISTLANEGCAITLLQASGEKLSQLVKENGSYVDIVLISGGNKAVNDAIIGILGVRRDRRPHLAVLPKSKNDVYAKAFQIRTIEDSVRAILKSKGTEVALSLVRHYQSSERDSYFYSQFKTGFLADFKERFPWRMLPSLFGKKRSVSASLEGAEYQVQDILIFNGRYDMGKIKLQRGLDWTTRGFRVVFSAHNRISMLVKSWMQGLEELSDKKKNIQIKYASRLRINAEEENRVYEVDGVIKESLPIAVVLSNEFISVMA